VNPILNPFSPGAGAPPPELVGREEILEQARVLLGRALVGMPEKPMIMTGLRGVGKTVLLNEIEAEAEKEGFQTIELEVSQDESLADMLATHLRSVLFELDRIQGISEKVKRGLRVFRSFLGTAQVTLKDITFGLAVDPELGVGDSGNLEADLPDLFAAVAEAAKDRGTGVALFIDEIQYLASEEFSALIMAMHRIQQKTMPLVLVGAGLPTVPGLAGNAKSYAERLFSYPRVGALSRADSHRALTEPVKPQDVVFDTPVLDEVFHLTKGYPYFLQEWGYQCWNVAEGPRISLDDLAVATSKVIPRLDQSFFRVRFDRLTPAQRRYLRAMAEFGEGPCRTGDIAKQLGAGTTSSSPTRDQLIKKGMIYSPSHGEIAFTVPLFDEFMKRAMPEGSC
jgi:hypothetical protein